MHTDWLDAILELPVISSNALRPASVDPGVNFFVLRLDQLGCETQWSCEGHPSEFYISFTEPPIIAHASQEVGHFTIELWNTVYRLTPGVTRAAQGEEVDRGEAERDLARYSAALGRKAWASNRERAKWLSRSRNSAG